MKIIDLVNFLKTPADRDVIRRWTRPPGAGGHALELPPPPDPDDFVFLVLGDSGDSAGIAAVESPQDAVARFMAADAALPESGGDASMVLHTGDVVYFAGERRLYDRNFRRPYSAFLMPESTVDNLVFRLPFLPVPGNHDYYDFSGWASAVARLPMLGAGVQAIARELFSFHIPHGGSDMGAAYMNAFVEPNGRLPYEPGRHTRIPNRYYRYRVGPADFFALDSNTLESPPPSADLERERESARGHVRTLEKRARALSREIRRDEEAVARWLAQERRQAAEQGGGSGGLIPVSAQMAASLDHLEAALDAAGSELCAASGSLRARWQEALDGLGAAKRRESRERAIEAMDAAGDECCDLLEEVEACFVTLPEGPERDRLLAARDGVAEATRLWRLQVTGRPPEALCDRIGKLSQSALDVQRELARERRRVGRQAEDYDRDQLDWLRQGLAESRRERPDGWRIVNLHQPLYTTIGGHSENSDVLGVRENLIPILREHDVHLVLAGHSHAFEWFRSALLPTTGLIVTGGGGQPWLWRSILDPRLFHRYRGLAASLREGGATECLVGGRGPAAPDGEDGPLYNYVRIRVRPDVLTVSPVGVRRTPRGYRREAPMPVFHVPEFQPGEPIPRPPWNPRVVEAISVRRGEAPSVRWG